MYKNVCFVERFLSFCTFSFGHCVVNPVISHERGKDREVFTTSCPSFFDLRLSDYHVYPQEYLSTFIRSLLFVDILLACLIFWFFPVPVLKQVSCTRQEKNFHYLSQCRHMCHLLLDLTLNLIVVYLPIPKNIWLLWTFSISMYIKNGIPMNDFRCSSSTVILFHLN
jgi:hypothetical protein